MAVLRFCLSLALILLASAAGANAADPPAVPSSLYDRPVLVIDPGMHTARIWRATADRDGRFAVTGSDDKTVRIWSLDDGRLLRTIRLPAGPGNVGMVYAVAISPDGTLIAAGGWMRWSESDQQEQIDLFDRMTGRLAKRISGLPNGVADLTFSPDGMRLATSLGGGEGSRVHSRQSDWGEIARDENYRDHSFGADFSFDGRLATTSWDGKIRLYPAALQGRVTPVSTMQAPGGERPYGIAFSPDGTRLAVGYDDTTNVDRLDAHALALLPRPNLDGVNNGSLVTVAWSRDGSTLFAAGRYEGSSGFPILAWADGGTGARRSLSAGLDTVMSLVPLAGGDLLVASADPYLARLSQDYTPRWQHHPRTADFRGQGATLSVSVDGARIGFGYEEFGGSPGQFDLATRALSLGSATGPGLHPPRQTGLAVANWRDPVNPMLGSQPLRLEPHERSRSLAIVPAGDRFVLGTEWMLRAFTVQGALLWARPAPGAVWAVNITGDGRLVVAAYQDGTIRWHRMSDGVELLAFMPLANRKDWVAWTPEGFYAATAGAQGVLRWHVNQGWDAAATDVPVADIPGSYRPAVLPLVLQELETPRALGLAMLAEHNNEVMLRTNSHVPPGTRLHLLAVGVSNYQQDTVAWLRLHYADRDASDLVSAIRATQGALYQIEPQTLLNQDANKKGILQALATMARHMASGSGNDLAVIHFSGHGAMIGTKLYLLPYDADVRDEASIKATGLPADELRDELLELAKNGRVLMLLDACHSGATTMNGARVAINTDVLRTSLAAPTSPS